VVRLHHRESRCPLSQLQLSNRQQHQDVHRQRHLRLRKKIHIHVSDGSANHPHRHTVHGGNQVHVQHIRAAAAAHIREQAKNAPDSTTDQSNDDKPCLLPLCTKCAHDGNKAASSSKSSLNSRPGFIITSQSFQEGASQLAADAAAKTILSSKAADGDPRRADGLASPGRTFFHRASIVKEEILTDGRAIGDFYDVNVGNLGKGSYGSVMKARDLRSGVIRAVKIVFKSKIENIFRLKREILIMKRLDHPNIIRLFEVFEDQKNLYLVLEICTGGELFDRIIKSGHFSERYAASLMKQVFSAINYCHSNDVMHRDLKPENLLYADPSPLSALKVIDWGFAAKCGKNHKFTSVVGTPYYVAPEVLFGNYDKQCDLWSAGVILYILLCGYPPFHGKDNKEILRKVKIGEFSFDPRHWKHVSDHAKELVKRLLTYDPRKRISAIEALQHPWVQYYTQALLASETPLSNKLGSDLLEKFKTFQRFNKMKKLAITCVAYQMTEREIGTLHDIFSALDKNGDGVLTVSEVSHALHNMSVTYGDEIQGILQELDTDGNGTIDYTEFIAASIDHKLYEQESVCRSAFRVFDLDGDGKITIDEMHNVLEMNFVREAFTRDIVEEMIKEVDTNNDGSIDFEEFMKMMRGNQKKKFETTTSPFSRARALLYRKLE